MSLTKDKLITRIQTQVGLDKQESRQTSGAGLGDNEGDLGQGG